MVILGVEPNLVVANSAKVTQLRRNEDVPVSLTTELSDLDAK
jgi:hypothetical protein